MQTGPNEASVILFVTKKTLIDKKSCFKLEGFSVRIKIGKEGEEGEQEEEDEDDNERETMEVDKVWMEVGQRGASIWHGIHLGMCYKIDNVVNIFSQQGIINQ